MRIFILLAALIAHATLVRAESRLSVREYSPDEISNCISTSAAKYQIHPYIVYAIAKGESNFNPAATNRNNKNGTADHGIMQVNDWWLRNVLHKHGITETDLYDACKNIEIGTWILAQCVQQHGYNWRAVGCYNAKDREKQDVYIRKVMEIYHRVRRKAGHP